MALKHALTFNECIKSAYLHYVLGVEQQHIAMAFEVNIGRVNEACVTIKEALSGKGLTRSARKRVKAQVEQIDGGETPVLRLAHRPGETPVRDEG